MSTLRTVARSPVKPLARAIASVSISAPVVVPLSYDPADLPWVAGRKRYWWHFDDDPVWTGTSGGGAQATAVGDAVASFQSGSGSDSYWLNQAGATSAIRRTDGVELPYLAHFEGNLGSQSDATTGGFTFGFCGYISSGTFSSNLLCASGSDFSPRDHALVINHNSVELEAWTSVSYAAAIDWTIPHRVIGVGEYVGSTVTGRLYIDGVLVAEQVGLTAGSWSRDLLYPANSSIVWNMRSRFVGAQAFTAADDIALIDRFLCLGADPLIPAGGWEDWLTAQKASWLDYGYSEDLTRLWQDDAAATPVTAAGDAVGAWRGQKDALTFIQPNASFRGVYLTAGVQLDATSGGGGKRLYAPLAHNYANPLTLGMSVYNISTTQPMRFGLQDTNDTTNLPIVGWTQTAGTQAARIRGTSTNMTTAAGRRTYVMSYNGSAARLINSTGALSSPTVGSGTTSGTNLVLAASPSDGNGRWLTWVVKLGSMTDDELTYLHYWLRYRRHLE